VSISSVAASTSLADEGKLRRIAITSKDRFPGVEDIPTVAETIPGFRTEGYIPLLAPADLPPVIAQRMNRVIDEVLKEPEVLKRFQVFGYATSGAGTPEGVAGYIKADRELWATFARDLGFEPK
jgi:tripartite-type tricarboxylate transporter receptor subunit TctC